jgi:N-ethylmaleimide reductase
MSALFTPLSLGPLTFANRIVMAPLTRCRADADHVPTDIMAEYYAQRAGAGLIVAEATMVIEGNSAFNGREPGIYSEAQVAAWKKVTDAVHAKRGLIWLQLWHGGRACHSYFNGGVQPVAPSPLAITGDETHTPEGPKPYEVPRELRDDELPGIVEGFRKAAENAKAAGFDGVEIHGANGYLLDEFLRDGANKRTGPYGGPVENRARLLLEVTDAVCTVWDKKQVGVRISPLNSYNAMIDSDPVGLTRYVSTALSERGIGYLHLMRSDFFGVQKSDTDIVAVGREAFQGVLITNMGYTREEADVAISEGKLDAVAFGHQYVSNPDLAERLRQGKELSPPDSKTFYTHEAHGYTDYPALAAA